MLLRRNVIIMIFHDEHALGFILRCKSWGSSRTRTSTTCWTEIGQGLGSYHLRISFWTSCASYCQCLFDNITFFDRKQCCLSEKQAVIVLDLGFRECGSTFEVTFLKNVLSSARFGSVRFESRLAQESSFILYFCKLGYEQGCFFYKKCIHMVPFLWIESHVGVAQAILETFLSCARYLSPCHH